MENLKNREWIIEWIGNGRKSGKFPAARRGLEGGSTCTRSLSYGMIFSRDLLPRVTAVTHRLWPMITDGGNLD